MTDATLKSFVDRLENLDAEQKGIGTDKRDVFNEADAAGFDKKAVRRLLRDRREAAKDKGTAELAEQYKMLLSEPGATYRSVAEKTGAKKSAVHRLVPKSNRGTEPPHDPATGEITPTHEMGAEHATSFATGNSAHEGEDDGDLRIVRGADAARRGDVQVPRLQRGLPEAADGEASDRRNDRLGSEADAPRRQGASLGLERQGYVVGPADAGREQQDVAAVRLHEDGGRESCPVALQPDGLAGGGLGAGVATIPTREGESCGPDSTPAIRLACRAPLSDGEVENVSAKAPTRHACPSTPPQPDACSTGSKEWQVDSLRWRGRVLTGQHGHWCPDYDELPIDETCPEWPCPCSASDGWHGPVQEFWVDSPTESEVVPSLPLGAVAEGDSPQRVAGQSFALSLTSPPLPPSNGDDPGPLPSFLRRVVVAPSKTPERPNEREGAAT